MSAPKVAENMLWGGRFTRELHTTFGSSRLLTDSYRPTTMADSWLTHN